MVVVVSSGDRFEQPLAFVDQPSPVHELSAVDLLLVLLQAAGAHDVNPFPSVLASYAFAHQT